MTIEEQLAVFLRDHLFECGASVEGQTVSCDDERIPVGSRFKCSCRSGAHELLVKFLPLIAAELAGVARDPKLIDQVSRGLAAGWRGNPNMSGDDRDFMHPSMRRRHDEKSADACEFIALAIEAHARKMGEAS